MGLRIQDSLYGIVDLNDYERKVIDSKSFQRLLSIKQLGFAYSVFPGADYSRFSHCIGAAHVMGKLVASLNDYGAQHVSDTDTKIYRFAALLHDIGHYPFSHALEYAIKRRYETDLTAQGSAPIEYLKHEQVGAELLRLDSKLYEAVASCGISVDSVRNVFSKKDPVRLTGLISSDIDADRLDYLLRTAHHTGLPYGCVDQNYIVREIRVDKNGRMCWSARSLGALDHMLLGRAYDYRQIVHNKTVVGLEELLKDIVYDLTDPALGEARLDLSAAGVRQMISDGVWFAFDDHQLFEKIKKSDKIETADDGFHEKCEALLERNPPRRVAERASLESATFEPTFDKVVKQAREFASVLAEHHGLKKSLVWVWAKKLSFTSYEGRAMPSEDDEGTGEMVRVLNETTRESILAVRDPQSVVGKLCTTWRYIVRIYVLVNRDDARRPKIEVEASEFLNASWRDAVAVAEGTRLDV